MEKLESIALTMLICYFLVFPGFALYAMWAESLLAAKISITGFSIGYWIDKFFKA